MKSSSLECGQIIIEFLICFFIMILFYVGSFEVFRILAIKSLMYSAVVNKCDEISFYDIPMFYGEMASIDKNFIIKKYLFNLLKDSSLFDKKFNESNIFIRTFNDDKFNNHGLLVHAGICLDEIIDYNFYKDNVESDRDCYKRFSKEKMTWGIKIHEHIFCPAHPSLNIFKNGFSDFVSSDINEYSSILKDEFLKNNNELFFYFKRRHSFVDKK